MSITATPAHERFWRFVDGSDVDTCWQWTGQDNGKGYGKFNVTARAKVRAHRFAYELLIGPIPEGYDIDHLCANSMCVNPWHMEPVPPHVNRARQTARRRTA